MKKELNYQLVCEMLQSYDIATGNRGADHVIANPSAWIGNTYQPFYSAAAELIISLQHEMSEASAKSFGKSSLLKAMEAVVKNAKKARLSPSFCGAQTIDGVQYVCDGHMAIANYDPIPGLLEAEYEKPVDFKSIMNPGSADYSLNIPTQKELKVLVTECKAKLNAQRIKKVPIILDLGGVYVNAELLLIALQAVGGTDFRTAWSRDARSPIFFLDPQYRPVVILLPVGMDKGHLNDANVIHSWIKKSKAT